MTVARVHGSIKFPARFMLVAAMNPTRQRLRLRRPDGARQVPREALRPAARPHRHPRRSAGRPLPRADRQASRARAARRCASRCTRARDDAAQALRRTTRPTPAWTRKQLKSHCDLSDSCLLLMKQAMDELGLSARAYDKVRRVARTIADIEGVGADPGAPPRRGGAVPVAGPEVLTSRSMFRNSLVRSTRESIPAVLLQT